MLCAREIRRSSQLLSAALGATSDVVVIIDDDGVIGYASPAAERVLGRPARQLRDRPVSEFVHDDDRDALFDLLAHVSVGLSARSPAVVRVRAERADGRWAELEAARLEPVAVAGQTGVMVVLRDVTALVQTERDLDRVRAEYDFVATHDAVTGLPNRAELERRLDELCEHDLDAARGTQMVMAKVLDVDELRERYGAHDADAVVRMLGRAIRTTVTPGAFVAVGETGEFVVVNAPGTSPTELDELTEQLTALADQPLCERIPHVELSLVVGRTDLVPERGAAASVDQLVHAARWASAGSTRSPVVHATPGRDDARERLRLVPDVARAFAADELALHYQPIRDAHSGRVAGFEGLLRWNHPDDGVVCASEFLPAVEGTALIVDIGDFVLAQGCAQLARWQRRYGENAPSLALNVSARQLRNGDFAGRVYNEVARSGADPAGLCLELTETHALEREPCALADLARVRQLGASIALDDFGTGYSSLHHLQRIAADVLKIDRSFVRNVGIDTGATAIVRAAIELGAAFGMTTVAEGVTTVEQHRLLLAMGCDRIQGFLIAPAVPAELAEAMLRAEPSDGPGVGVDDPEKDVDVLRARGRLALIDEQYVPSEDEVAALAGMTADDARSGLTRLRRRGSVT